MPQRTKHLLFNHTGNVIETVIRHQYNLITSTMGLSNFYMLLSKWRERLNNMYAKVEKINHKIRKNNKDYKELYSHMVSDKVQIPRHIVQQFQEGITQRDESVALGKLALGKQPLHSISNSAPIAENAFSSANHYLRWHCR